MNRTLLLILILPFSVLLPQEKVGEIAGQVIDGATQQPLVGVNILVVERPSAGAPTNEDGNFFIGNLPVGEYSLRASIIGYQPSVLTNVVVSTGRSTKVKIKLSEIGVELQEVEVKADYFSNAGSISPVSTVGLNGAEVKRSPGSAQDMQRIVQNLPNVGNTNDQTNELVVRGGAPNENLTVMDYIEIPSTNHYPNQFNSGGPINMVNVDLIEDINFSTGGFPAQYGDRMSSVMDITIREGDRQRAFASNTGAHFAGFGAVMEGGFAGGKGSWLFSARQSFLEVMDKIVGITAFGITAIPKYYDTQCKVVYDLSPTQKLLLSGIYGNDRIFLRGDPKEKNPQKKSIIDSSGVQDVDFQSEQYAYGISLKSLWGAKGFSVLTLSGLGNTYFVDVRSNFTRRLYDNTGVVLDSRHINSRRIFHNDSKEQLVGLKYDLVYRLIPNHEISAGISYLTTQHFLNDVALDPDTARYDLNNDGRFEIPRIVIPAGAGHADISFGEERKNYVYVSDKVYLAPTLTATAGIRYDYFSYSRKDNLSPRFSFSYEILPPTTKVNFAYGEFYQAQSLPLYGDRLNAGINKHLENSHSRHVVLGIEHLFGDGLKASLEWYDKHYTHLPVSEQFINSADRTFRSERILNVGKRRSSGIELFVQQKQVEDYYGTFSVSYSSTRMEDPRVDRPGFGRVNVGSYPSEYDLPIIITIVAGKVVKDVRSILNESPFYVKYPAMLFPFADDMELSARFRYSSGKPYTPKIFVPNEQHVLFNADGNPVWSRGAWVDADKVNSARYPDYKRFDFQWLSRYHFEKYNIVFVLVLQNLFNQDNIAEYRYRSDGTIETVHQFSFFPVAGVGVEF